MKVEGGVTGSIKYIFPQGAGSRQGIAQDHFWDGGPQEMEVSVSGISDVSFRRQ